MKQSDDIEGADERHKPLYQETRKALGRSIFNGLQVAGEKDGEPCKLTQEELVECSGVARSTIAKYLAAKDDAAVPANPDLETICRLAKALNVPPALMLLSADDWARIANAALMMLEAVDDDVVLGIVAELRKGRARASERGESGLKVAERANLYTASSINSGDARAPMREELIDQQRAHRASTRRGIMVAAAIAPLQDLTPEYHAPLLWMCASLGASTNLK
jgi:transcriptional regulator with XRE-family HTH domain